MDFSLDDGQRDLQQAVSSFCNGRFPLDKIASREGAVVNRSVWSELADLGVLSLIVPEDRGGLGLGVVDASIVYEQLGSYLAPGPLVWSALAAQMLPGAATGDELVAGVQSTSIEDGSALVPHGLEADTILVLGDGGVSLHRPAKSAREHMEALDPLGTVALVSGLDDAEMTGDTGASHRLAELGSVLTASMLVGVASRSLETARAYALERQQFGTPIGSFQAVKHILADMYVRMSVAQSATYAAAAVLDEPDEIDSGGTVSRAKLLAAEAALSNASCAIQVLGGMGFTWDMLPNYLLKRAWTLESDFGSRTQHMAYLGSALGAQS